MLRVSGVLALGSGRPGALNPAGECGLGFRV